MKHAPIIYFIEAVGLDLVKIGTTEDLDRRMAHLAAVCPTPIVLLKQLPGGRSEERELHSRWGAHRVHHEWFQLAPLVAEIEGLAEFIAATRREEIEAEARVDAMLAADGAGYDPADVQLVIRRMRRQKPPRAPTA